MKPKLAQIDTNSPESEVFNKQDSFVKAKEEYVEGSSGVQPSED